MSASSILPRIVGKFHDLRQPLIKVRISNAITNFDGDEFLQAPASQKSLEAWALVDTGATITIIDIQIQRDLMLPQQGSAPVLFPNMPSSEFHPTYTCALGLMEHYSEGSAVHDWIDWPRVFCFSLENRAFSAVIGMDILSKAKLRMEKGLPEISY